MVLATLLLPRVVMFMQAIVHAVGMMAIHITIVIHVMYIK
jgi:hypothetical protein